MKQLPFWCVVLLAGTVVAPVATALDGREIAERVDSRPDGDTTHALVQMVLIDRNGATSERVIEQYGAEDAEGLGRGVIMFHEPASVRDTRFLTVENAGRDDDQWIYLPALRRVRRIAASEGGNSFMGTDFSYDDLSPIDIDDYEYELIGDESIQVTTGGRTVTKAVHTVRARAKDPDDSNYGYTVQYVDPETWVPLRIDIYDTDNDLLKVNTVERIELVQGYWTIIENTMENVQTGHRTELRIRRFEYDQNVPAGLFTTNFLQTGRP